MYLHQMSYETLDIARRIRENREALSLSQRDLSKLSGVPQAQISRIESGLVDLRFSSLVALASALDTEIALVPRRAMPAVKSLMGTLGIGDKGTAPDEPRPAYTLDDEDEDG
jgi:transcriptional regulator with XRE-family HTH domain